jgi:Peptidase propeptide and YPEB domain
MNRPFSAAALLALLVAASGPVAAQPSGSADAPGPEDTVGFMSEEVVRARLSSSGYAQITNLTRLGNRYEATATKDGRTINVVIDARTGAIEERNG